MADDEEVPIDDDGADEDEPESPKEDPKNVYNEEEVPIDDDGADEDEPESPKEEPKNVYNEEEAPPQEEAQNDDYKEPAQEDVPDPEQEPESPKEEPKNVYKEEPKEDYKKEEPKPEPKEEPKKVVKKKRKYSRKRSSKKSSNLQDINDEALKAWKQISHKKNDKKINWYICKLKGKPGKSKKLLLASSGYGGAKECSDFLKEHEKGIFFGLIKCKTTDDAQSIRSKFIYIRFVGSKVGMMSAAKLTPTLGVIDDNFPCKHLTLDLNENCEEDLDPKKLAIELLRVGGAHKPDKMDFGPEQIVDVKDL